MTRYNVEDGFEIEGVNTHVKEGPDPVIEHGRVAWVDPEEPGPQTTTGYGLNEPQWTIGMDIPPLIHSRSPYARVPLPPLFKINPVLSFRDQPALDWTIDQAPDIAVLAVGYTHLDPYHWMSEPATDPPTRTPVTIYIERLDFRITVSPKGTWVTVGDILMAVYVGARRCVTERMLVHVGLDVGRMEGLVRMVEEVPRTRGIRSGDDEVCSNVRQSVGFWTEWVGLAPSDKDDDVWCLYTKALGR